MRGVIVLALAWATRACEDLKLANGDIWNDAGGPDYNCAYYDQKDHCTKWGNQFENEGKTAKDACCACGGGDGASSVGDNGGCVDVLGLDGNAWHDNGSVDYNCSYYSTLKRCSRFGSKYDNDGHNANSACCVCGGGIKEGTDGTDGSSCEDLKTSSGDVWHDAYGDSYTCAYYDKASCDKWGSSFAWSGMTASDACCTCGGGSGSDSSSSAECVVSTTWKHFQYNDDCNAYLPGGPAEKWNCDTEVKINCCTCGDTASNKLEVCSDKTLADGSPWHDNGGVGYDCTYYGLKADRCELDGNAYDFEGMTANTACCVCGGGNNEGAVACEDIKLPNGSPFFDSGGETYDCNYYAKKPGTRCGKGKDGDMYENQGLTANEACCVCGGGNSDTDGLEEQLGLTEPSIDTDNKINYEWIDGKKFRNKKHLAGDFILYWNAYSSLETLEVALLGPAGWNMQDRWISIGFSTTGGMAGSDAVVTWVKADGEANIQDLYLENQSPSGVKAMPRQDLTDASLVKWEDRLILRFTRPWAPDAGGAAISPADEYVKIIYAKGKASSRCDPMCNHVTSDRWKSTVAFTAPSSLNIWELNEGQHLEPCDGPADLSCSEGLSCFHENAYDGDYFKKNLENYGKCMNPEELGDQTDDEDNTGTQYIFEGDGGFENTENLNGGFVLMWTVNKLSEPGSYGPDDTIQIALVSTSPKRQGYIGFGFSPNGLMMGSDVVVGWRYEESYVDEPDWIGDYYLPEQVPNLNVVRNKQGIFNERLIIKNGQRAISFERPLTPADSVQILEGDVHIIYAYGPTPKYEGDEEQLIPYHKYREKQDVMFIPFTGEYADANSAAGMMTPCGGGGPDEVVCKSDLMCMPLPDEFFEVDWSSMMQEASADSSGFTTQSDWNDAGGNNNPFADIEQLRGKGICLTPGMVEAASGYDFAKIGEGLSQVIDVSIFTHHKKLRWGFDIYWKHLPDEKIKIGIIGAIGPGWMGLGFGTTGLMIGATAVCGWKEFGNADNTLVDEYYLNDKLPWEIKSIENADEDYSTFSMEVEDMEIENLGHENALIFTRPLVPSNGFAPIVPGTETVILYAVGTVPNPSDNFFGYHRFRDVARVDFSIEPQQASKP